jgi:radical SAM superfamily enzyme YgiQ (UPF0313 family)
MRILLIKPPPNRKLVAPSGGEPLELEYLAAAVKEHEVEILDMRFDRRLERKLEIMKPRFVGLTGYTCDANSAKQVMREVKKFDPGITTGVGGHHATFLPSDFALPFVDVIFLGMADLTFPEYIETLERGRDAAAVSNLALNKNGGLLFTQSAPFAVDLDRLPLPARDLTRQYRKGYHDQNGTRNAMVLTSRGCPFRCNFCACWKLLGGKYLVRSPESVVQEMTALPEDIEQIFFADDNTLHNVQHAWRLARLIRESGIRLKFSMFARADTVVKHPDLIRYLKECGLTSLTVGIESIRDEELAAMNKRTTAATNVRAIEILHEQRISIGAHFIVNPEFTREDFDRLFQYVDEHNLFRPVYTVLTPYPGTDLYLENQEKILIRDFDFYDVVHAIFPTRLGRREFYRELERLYLRTYSFRRYFRSIFRDFVLKLRNPKRSSASRPDRLPLVKLALLHLFLLPLLFRFRRIYKHEPIAARGTAAS